MRFGADHHRDAGVSALISPVVLVLHVLLRPSVWLHPWAAPKTGEHLTGGSGGCPVRDQQPAQRSTRPWGRWRKLRAGQATTLYKLSSVVADWRWQPH